MVLRSGRTFNREPLSSIPLIRHTKFPSDPNSLLNNPDQSFSYDILQHMDRTPARISILELIKKSRSHQEVKIPSGGHLLISSESDGLRESTSRTDQFSAHVLISDSYNIFPWVWTCAKRDLKSTCLCDPSDPRSIHRQHFGRYQSFDQRSTYEHPPSLWNQRSRSITKHYLYIGLW